MNITKKKNSKGGLLFAILFCTPFFLIGVGMGVKLARDAARSTRTAKWPTVAATITAAQVRKVTSHSSDGDSTSYKLTTAYHYTVAGKRYQGERAGLTDDAPFGVVLRKRAAALTAAEAAGTPLPCHVNPGNPAEAVIFPALMWDTVLFFLIFVIVFGGVGLGGFIGVAFHHKHGKATAALQAAHPDEPWLHNPRWARGPITANAKAGAVGMWIFAIIWNAISLPVAFIVPQAFAEGNKAALIGLIFPLCGCGLLMAAIVSTLRWRKYGKVQLVLASLPGVIGGSVRGAVQIPTVVQVEKHVELTLSCGKMVSSGSGKNRSTSRHIQWQSEHLVAPAELVRTHQTLIPVNFTVPATCPATDAAAQIDWKLDVRAQAPGLDLATQFELPVFRTDATDPALTEAVVAREELAQRPDDATPILPKISFVQRGATHLDIRVPPLFVRSPSMIPGTLIFMICWSAALWATIAFSAPVIFPIILGLLELGLIWGILCWSFGSSHTTLGKNGAVVRHTFPPRTRNAPLDAIFATGMEKSGSSSSGSKTTVYQTVFIYYTTQDDRERKLKVVTMIPNRRAAVWLKDRIEGILIELGVVIEEDTLLDEGEFLEDDMTTDQ
jgi:hypothetical protein